MNKCVVIMSVYKNDKLEYVKSCLDSLYNQTYNEFDIFIQQDGNIPKEIDQYLKNELKKKQIAYLGIREKNMGLAYSLNELLNIAIPKNYTYIIRMDSDDICIKDRIEKQFDFMERNKDIDVCGGDVEEFGDDKEYSKIVKYPKTHEEMFSFFAKRVPISHPTAFFRNTYFQKINAYYDTTTITNEDTMLWLDGFKHGCIFANVDHIVLKFRISDSFFKRRAGKEKIISDFKDRLKVIRDLNYGISSYFYAIGVFIINILPSNLKRIAYKNLR